MFAWSYLYMFGIDPKVVTHNIVLEDNDKLVRYKIHKMHLKVALLVKDDIENLLQVGFIYPID